MDTEMTEKCYCIQNFSFLDDDDIARALIGNDVCYSFTKGMQYEYSTRLSTAASVRANIMKWKKIMSVTCTDTSDNHYHTYTISFDEEKFNKYFVLVDEWREIQIVELLK
jgi:hypothetical protein